MEKFCKYVEIPLPDYSVDRWASWKLYQLLINLLVESHGVFFFFIHLCRVTSSVTFAVVLCDVTQDKSFGRKPRSFFFCIRLCRATSSVTFAIVLCDVTEERLGQT